MKTIRTTSADYRIPDDLRTGKKRAKKMRPEEAAYRKFIQRLAIGLFRIYQGASQERVLRPLRFGFYSENVLRNQFRVFALIIFLSASQGVLAQCAGFPATVDQKDCSQYAPLTNNATLNPGDTAGFCPPDPTEVVFTGVNLFGGTIRICGNTSLSGNFNSGTIVVQCGSTLRIPSSVTMNNGVKIVNYGSVLVNGTLTFQNVNNAFYNENDSSRLIISGDLVFPQNNGQNAYLKNNGYIEIGGSFDALDGGFCCFSNGSELQCTNFRYIMNCGGPSNRFTNDGSGGTAIIRYSNQAHLRATLTASSNFDIYQASGSSFNLNGCGSFGSANLVPNAPALTDPGSSNTNCINNCFMVLPVELIDFEGRCDAGNIKLNWSTASEENNDYFAIEKSADGIQFTEVAKVNGAGTTTQTSHYTWKDDASESTHYYRLRQVDLNGAARVYSTVSVNPCMGGTRVYPNPCDEWLNVRIDPEKIFTLSDCKDKTILEGDLSQNNGRIYMGAFASGVYYLTLGTEVFRVVKK